MIAGAILTGLVLFFCWLLLSPVFVEIDTRVPELRVRYKGICTMAVLHKEGRFLLQLRIISFRKSWVLGEGRKKQVQQKYSHKVNGKRRKGNVVKLVKLVRLVRSFRVDKLELVLDTGDPVSNARLYPLNFLPYPSGICIRINFEENNHMVASVSNRPWRMLAAWWL